MKIRILAAGAVLLALAGLVVAQNRFYYFNEVGYVFPAAQGVAGTVLTNDGTGTLAWSAPPTTEGLWSGSVIISTSTCPAGYTRLAAADDRFLRGSSTAGTTGGATTHTHTMSGASAGQSVTMSGSTAGQTVGVTGTSATATANHSHTATLGFTGVAGGASSVVTSVTIDAANASHSHGVGTLSGASHTHGVGTLAGASHTHGAGTLTAAAANHNPAYYTVILCRKD